MGRIWLLALVCAACARSTGGGAGTYRATIEFSEVTCAGKPYPGQVVDVQIIVK